MLKLKLKIYPFGVLKFEFEIENGSKPSCSLGIAPSRCGDNVLFVRNLITIMINDLRSHSASTIPSNHAKLKAIV